MGHCTKEGFSNISNREKCERIESAAATAKACQIKRISATVVSTLHLFNIHLSRMC
jgi:hypothetical protein